MKITAVVTASHVGRESITHVCGGGQTWEDPTEGFRFVHEFESPAQYERQRGQLVVEATLALQAVVEATSHCQCRKLLRPGAKWAESVALDIVLHPEHEAVGV